MKKGNVSSDFGLLLTKGFKAQNITTLACHVLRNL